MYRDTIRGLPLGVALFEAPIASLGVVGAWSHSFGASSVAILVTVTVILVSAAVAAMRFGVVVRCSTEYVVVGLALVWSSKIRWEDVADVDVVEVDAYADYGGWGVKGSPRQPRGRLYSIGGRRAIRVATNGGRAYLVAFRDGTDVERVRAAMLARL